MLNYIGVIVVALFLLWIFRDSLREGLETQSNTNCAKALTCGDCLLTKVDTNNTSAYCEWNKRNGKCEALGGTLKC